MLITVRELSHDTQYFFSKQIKNIFYISVFISLFSMFLNFFIKPDAHIISILENNKFINANSLLELIKNMNIEDKQELLKYSILKIIQLLITKTLLLGSIINFIFVLSNNENKEITISSLFSLSYLLPNLFILNFLTTLITQLGFLFLVIPGVLLSMLLSLSPIIFSFKKHSIIDSMRLSINISSQYIKIIGPGILFWICGKFILTTIFSNVDFINDKIIFLISNTSINILYSILIIYLFRFYMIFLRV